MNFGDKLYLAVANTRGLLFTEGEMTNLAYISYENYVEVIEKHEENIISFSHPVGYRPDNKTITSKKDYTKQELIDRYGYLGLTKLPKDSIYQLVTITENLLNFLLKSVLIEYPQKIGKKKKIDVEIVLEAESLESIKINIVDSILNEIAYKSPKDYAVEFNDFIGINLLEIPSFHRYIELKTTRDIHIHNNGVANEIYLRKADTMARVKNGEFLPVDIHYFLQSYECCLQLTEVLEQKLNGIWASDEYKNYKENLNKNGESNEQEEKVEEIIKKSKEDMQ